MTMTENNNTTEPSWYSTIPLVTSQTETVNGYNLMNTVRSGLPPILSYEDFQTLRVLFEDKTSIVSLDEFMEMYDNTACTDWDKMDSDGESFRGFWDYPIDSDVFKNAPSLTRKANGEMLYDLPFPKRFLIETIKLGCNSRIESVRFSNFVGVWMERKIAQSNVGD